MKRWSRPFPIVLVPVFEGCPSESSLALAGLLDTSVHLLGLVQVNQGLPLSGGSAAARELRKVLRKYAAQRNLEQHFQISVSFNAWQDLHEHIHAVKPDLVILDWEALNGCHGVDRSEILAHFGANLVVVHGQVGTKIARSLVPLRGGPHAQLALRLAMALPTHQISAVHLQSGRETSAEPQAPFRGLARILPSLPEVRYELRTAEDPLDEIRTLACEADVLIIGTTARGMEGGPQIGPVAGGLLESSPCPVIMVKSERDEPNTFTGAEAERSGSEAISILVDKWFAENTYHAAEFDHLAELVKLKQAQKLTISLVLPALNEEATVGTVISTVQKMMVEKFPLLDEIILMDSNSTDRTREIASSLGVPVYTHQDLLPQYGARAGKGEALWKSLYVTKGDIVIWIDSDIVNIHPRFVYGVLGPLLQDPRVQFVKGFYQRPLRSGRKVSSTGGGRVTELTARPLFNLFYPELSGVIQPLSGEYGGRRSALEQLIFYSGYGVETGLLIDVFEKFGLKAIAQVDLLERIHHNQSLQALSKMSFVIIQTMLSKLEKRFQLPLLEEVNKSMKLIEYQNGAYYLNVQELAEQERSPMIELPEYCQRFAREETTHAGNR